MKSKIIKRCSDCGRFLSEDDFNKNCYCCKKCNKNRVCLWRLNNDKNKEYCSKYAKQWYVNNEKHKKEYDKEYYRENKNHKRKYVTQWRKKNPEYKKQYNINNRKRNNEYSRKWRRTNRSKVYVINAKRRARKINQTVKLTEMETKRIYYLYKFSSILGKYFVVDHVKPISKGGLHHHSNLQILTAELNREKSDKWPLTEEEKIKYEGFRI